MSDKNQHGKYECDIPKDDEPIRNTSAECIMQPCVYKTAHQITDQVQIKCWKPSTILVSYVRQSPQNLASQNEA